ncbi:hypothetical protein [Brumimicrobium mesophilum]|uniref:hypothetical protein n=1 Tax=Brumimicrobium mesophilum TaxID=392717 RepID=UPI000D1438F8|nr:hypothetical protein [Brumimicrobium mesophilum]
MNTTKLITLTSLLCLGLTISSCKKEGCTDATATNYSSDAEKDDGSCVYAQNPPAGNLIDGNRFATFTIDGNTISEEESMSLWAGTTVDKEISGSATEAVYASYLLYEAEMYTLIDVKKGVNFYGGYLNDDDFYDYFEPGLYPFSDLSEQGVSITIGMPGGIMYSSMEGDQTGSTFEIVSRKQVLVGSTIDVRVHVKFNCKVYNGTDVKVVTDGDYVGNFSK